MLTRFQLFVGLVWLSFGFALATAEAATRCQAIDLMPDFWRSLGDADAAALIRTTLITTHPDLYNENYVGVPTGAKWDELIARERKYVEAHRKEVNATESYLSAQVQPLMTEFQRRFADFKCDFPFYIAPSFGMMDGAAGFVNGRHEIIFAPDVIPRYHPLSQLKVLIDHETFHIYHHQATGVYGASVEAIPTTLEALWSEGLATFASWRMNPEVSLDIALLQPGIPEGAKPHLNEIAKDLLAHLDNKDESTYSHYFEAGRQPDGYPPRSGYYVGVLIAQALSAQHTLPQLAHLNGSALHTSVVAELERMSTSH
jgi:Predicted Zn-dependent protease (DUF2268)